MNVRRMEDIFRARLNFEVNKYETPRRRANLLKDDDSCGICDPVLLYVKVKKPAAREKSANRPRKKMFRMLGNVNIADVSLSSELHKVEKFESPREGS